MDNRSRSTCCEKKGHTKLFEYDILVDLIIKALFQISRSNTYIFKYDLFRRAYCKEGYPALEGPS